METITIEEMSGVLNFLKTKLDIDMETAMDIMKFGIDHACHAERARTNCEIESSICNICHIPKNFSIIEKIQKEILMDSEFMTLKAERKKLEDEIMKLDKKMKSFYDDSSIHDEVIISKPEDLDEVLSKVSKNLRNMSNKYARYETAKSIMAINDQTPDASTIIMSKLFDCNIPQARVGVLFVANSYGNGTYNEKIIFETDVLEEAKRIVKEGI